MGWEASFPHFLVCPPIKRGGVSHLLSTTQRRLRGPAEPLAGFGRDVASSRSQFPFHGGRWGHSCSIFQRDVMETLPTILLITSETKKKSPALSTCFLRHNRDEGFGALLCKVMDRYRTHKSGQQRPVVMEMLNRPFRDPSLGQMIYFGQK